MFKKILAAFCAVVFSAMLTGCGTDMGNDISSDISSMMPDMNDSAQQDNSNNTNNNSVGHNSTPISEQQNSTTSQAKISKEKAKEIALEHAGVTEGNITDYEIDLDNENGVLVYEISFESNGKEYDYDVNANTGEIKNSKNELID